VCDLNGVRRVERKKRDLISTLGKEIEDLGFSMFEIYL